VALPKRFELYFLNPYFTIQTKIGFCKLPFVIDVMAFISLDFIKLPPETNPAVKNHADVFGVADLDLFAYAKFPLAAFGYFMVFGSVM